MKETVFQETWNDEWAQPIRDDNEAANEGRRPCVGGWWIVMVLVWVMTCGLAALVLAVLAERIG